MRIMIITNGYFPGKKYGGPPVSINNFCKNIDNVDCYIITKNHDLKDNKIYDNIENGWNKLNEANVLYLSDKDFNYNSIKKNVLEVNPDIIYIQSIFQSCTIPCLMLAKKQKKKLLLAVRGELCTGAFKKKYKKIPYLIFLCSLFHPFYTSC